MDDLAIQRERAQNLWTNFQRKFPLIEKTTEILPQPQISEDQIGGLAPAKEELLTYACGVTNPEVYERWGTVPPSALLLIGQQGVGKSLLAKALATRTQHAFLRVGVPRLVVELIQSGGKVGDVLPAWSHALGEMPPVTVFFEELEFSQTQEMGERRLDLPVGPIMDFLLEAVDRTVASESALVVGSTAYPDTLRHAFVVPHRFERVVEVTPHFPDDIVAALRIHAAAAEKGAGRTLFEEVDWVEVVRQFRGPATGDWIRLMHAVLRRKARCEAAGESVSPVTTADLLEEVERFRKTTTRLDSSGDGVYL
jgi:ATP-dependent 26S proteasome regulatory subunit